MYPPRKKNENYKQQKNVRAQKEKILKKISLKNIFNAKKKNLYKKIQAKPGQNRMMIMMMMAMLMMIAAVIIIIKAKEENENQIKKIKHKKV